MALCFVALMLDGVDIQLMGLAAPAIIKEWGVSRLAIAPALGGGLAGMVLGSMIGGLLGDRWGRRPTILLSLVLSGALTLATGMSHNLSQIVLLRVLGGMGFGALYPNVFPLIAELATPRMRSRIVILATVGTPFGVNMVAATGWAMPDYGWRACFYAAGTVTLVLALVSLSALPESLRLFEADDVGPGPVASAGPVGRFCGLASTGALFGRAIRRSTIGLIVFGWGIGFAAYAFLSWVPTLLTGGGLPLRLAIFGSLAVNLFTVLGTFAMAAVIPRTGSRIGVLVAIALLAFGSVALGFSMVIPHDAASRVAAIMASLACVGGGVGATGSCVFLLAVETYPIQLRASGSGLANAASRLGSVAVAFGGGLLLSSRAPNAWSFVLMVLAVLGVAAIGSSVVEAHLPRRRRSIEATAAAVARQA